MNDTYYYIRVMYDTQKPMAFLDCIIKASSKEDDIVFDPFCGCGDNIGCFRLRTLQTTYF